MKINKVLILENDSEFQGLPTVLKDIVEENDHLKFETWFWFGEDVRQNTEKSFKRFAALQPDTMLLTYPSFVGVGNSFEGKLRLFAALMEKGIKIKISVIFYPDFYWYLVKWANDMMDPRKKKVDIETLKLVLQYHEIYTIKYLDVHRSHQKTDFNELKRLTWEDLSKHCFLRKEKVKVVKTGEVYPLMYVHINVDQPDKSTVNLDFGQSGFSTKDEMPLTAITKI